MKIIMWIPIVIIGLIPFVGWVISWNLWCKVYHGSKYLIKIIAPDIYTNSYGGVTGYSGKTYKEIVCGKCYFKRGTWDGKN